MSEMGAPAGAADEPWVRQLVEAQQLAAVGQVAAGVAHEIGAPLTAISVAVEYLLRTQVEEASPIRGELEMILAQTRRISRLARGLVDLARPGTPVLTATDLNGVVSEGLVLMRRQLRAAGIETAVELEPELPAARGDADQLQQVLINLLLNAQRALEAVPSGARRVTVRTRRAEGAGELVVEDTGPGIEPEDREKIFLPFFSRGGGAGLGLSLARVIVHRHGGALRVSDAAGGGAAFVVRVPLWAGGDAD